MGGKLEVGGWVLWIKPTNLNPARKPTFEELYPQRSITTDWCRTIDQLADLVEVELWQGAVKMEHATLKVVHAVKATWPDGVFTALCSLRER